MMGRFMGRVSVRGQNIQFGQYVDGESPQRL